MENVKYVNGYKICSLYGKNWIRIFYHNSTTKEFFPRDRVITTKEVSYINTTNRFSILGHLDDDLKLEGKFNFLFYYPIELPDSFFFFNQTSNPLTTYSVSDFSSNYSKPSKCYYFETQSNHILKGLSISTSTDYTLIDGNPQSTTWLYAIGSYSSFKGEDSFPGPFCQPLGYQDTIGFKCAELWLRFDRFEILSKFPYLNINEIFNIRLPKSCRYTHSINLLNAILPIIYLE